ncbi:permease-like cell division protein FtsX [Nonomuraea pusilla]|uniref:FtsX extracellular domain-containing protein n=1 Tax=Nonomuraea pusilla TaxID=46177 RepID=A0A1H8D056_9ACTN|nr:permease-like cell division protein FtsX [Nonomuraea pusilla]SEN00616.1 hypothetical protein SAMN05660976_06611 [Nonomuraea pusilla]
MNSPLEDRLRDALKEAGSSLDPAVIGPLRTPGRRPVPRGFRYVAAAAVAGAVAVLWLGVPGAGGQRVATAPDAAAVEGAELAVFLCSPSEAYRPTCGGRDVTGAQRQAVESYLRGRPGVTQVRFVNREESYRRFRQEYAGQERILNRYTAADLPESYRVRVKPNADRQRLLEEVRGLQGVGLSVDLATLSSASRQRAGEELSAFLCMSGSTSSACGKKPRAATPAQKKAALAAIKELPGIVSVYFESRQEAFDDFRDAYAENKTLTDATRVEDMPESFRIILREGADRKKVAEALERLPGVAMVIDQRCLNQTFILTAEYGIREPKVC